MFGLKTLLVKSRRLATALVCGVGLTAWGAAPITGAQTLWPGYFVDNIQTKAVAGTGAEAQDIAFRNARLAGLREVSARMVCAEGRDALRIPNDVALQEMVQSLELTDQKIIGNSYSGLINIAFDPSHVKTYLASQQAAFADGPAPTQLALPILRIDGGPAMAFDDNPWTALWSQGPNRAFLQSYDVAAGDEEDRVTFDPELPSSAATQVLLDKYGFMGALVVSAELTTGPEGQPMDLFVEAIRVGEGYGPNRVEVAMVADAEETLESLLSRAAEQVQLQTSAAYCDSSKQQVMPVFSINVVVIGTDVPTWLQVQDMLRAREEINVLSLVGQREGALDISVTFSGGLSQLQQVFGSVNFRLMAYTTQQVPQDAVQVFFFAQPNFQTLPQNVRILPMSDIQLAN